jgi:hypothetical protein
MSVLLLITIAITLIWPLKTNYLVSIHTFVTIFLSLAASILCVLTHIIFTFVFHYINLFMNWFVLKIKKT